MRIFSFFSRNEHQPATADAYVDGELRRAALDAYEVHLQTCERCAALVSDARALKATIARLPEVSAPRSFAITPEMAARMRPARARAGTPLYLGFARAGAALSVVAFVTVVAMTTFDSSDSDQTAAGDFEAASGAAPAADAFTDDDSGKSDVVPEASAALAPSSSGGATGSGNATVVPLGSATPVPPSTGRQDTPTASMPAPQPPATGPEVVPSPADAGGGVRNGQEGESPGALTDVAFGIGPEAAAQDDNDRTGWLVGFGSLAVVSLIALGATEVLRRRRNA